MSTASAPVVAPGLASRVLVVDDSAVAREVLSTILRRDGFDVEIVSSAQAAFQRIMQRRPDVVLLDLEMPGMGGLEFLERIMRSMPLPVVVCSGIAQPGARAAIRALELGAVEVIPKPTGGIRAILEAEEDRISPIVAAAASANTVRLGVRGELPTLVVPVDKRPSIPVRQWNGSLIAIGASTGGTEALRVILSKLPADAPPVVVVQHMPAAFTGAFAQRLNALCAVEVREARDGDRLIPGVALIAPGGRHLEVHQTMGGLRARVHLPR